MKATENEKKNMMMMMLRRMFEFQTTIPVAKDLHVRVVDFDLVSADDVIGETVIDLENRFLSMYRATVGLPQTYCTSGVCQWRDCKQPTQLLTEFAETFMEKTPVFDDNETVRIGNRTYTLEQLGEQSAGQRRGGDEKGTR